GTQPSYSELAIFLPSESEFLEPEVFAALARRYVSPMTDRYIRIVNRVVANVAVWREGAIDEESAEVFNEYMIWATYVLYAQSTRAEGAGERATAGDVRAATALEAATARMRALGYLRFQDFAERLAKLYDERRESERLQ